MTQLPSLRQSTEWLGVVACIAFAVPAVFSKGLRWERALFLVPYVGIIGVLLLAAIWPGLETTGAAGQEFSVCHRQAHAVVCDVRTCA